LYWMRAAEAAAEIQQVWLNCAAFNADGSAMFEAGRAAEAELAALFVAAGLPTPGDMAAKNGRGAGKRVSCPAAVRHSIPKADPWRGHCRQPLLVTCR
jgi:hypothetical protein